jgi:uncharacterized protein (DUF1684 family)
MGETSIRHPARLAALMFTGLCAGVCGVAQAELGGYVAEIEKWREHFDADVRTGGWLELVGRAKLDEGRWTLGSDPKSALALPAKAPAEFGVLTRHGTVFLFEPAPGVSVTLGGKTVAESVELPTQPGSDRLLSGDLKVSVRPVGDDFYLLVADRQNPAIQAFKGTSWYPISTRYRVTAKFVPYAKPETVHVPLTHVTSKETMQSEGDLVFELAGKSLRLKTFTDDEGLFVMFQDPTSGKGSYGGGRFVHAPKPTDGVTALDFNEAFNPYCSLNPYIMCPIPPAQNRLPVKIEAGERYYGE